MRKLLYHMQGKMQYGFWKKYDNYAKLYLIYA